jgi:hypothetical protein
LVVVTAINDEDALATVALALAILAFSVQLIVYVAQQNLASEQGRRNEELYGSMQSVLAELREKAAGTQADVRAINERMLEALLSKNLAQLPGVQVDSARIASRVARETARAEEDRDPSNFPAADELIWPRRRASPEDQQLIELLRSYPAPDEVGDSLEVLQSLSDPDRIFLKGFGNDEISARQPDSMFDPSWPMAVAGGLESIGLVEPLPSDQQHPDSAPIGRLTEEGRQVARLLTAQGDPPPYLPGLEEIREKVAN